MSTFKFHWGHGLTLFITCFILTLVFVVIQSRKVDHSLVYDDYYAHDIAFEKEYHERAAGLQSGVTVTYRPIDKEVKFLFDQHKINGKVHFYRPSDQTLDFEKSIEVDEDKIMTVVTGDLMPGKWRVKINWEAEGQKYYKEKIIFL